MPSTLQPTSVQTLCFHCGENCEEIIVSADKQFCCQGCKTVYEILQEHDMCRYYDLEAQAGISLKGKQQAQYSYLDEPTMAEKLFDYQDDKIGKITFYLPQIHCASCIWLLEQLYHFNEDILQSKVNFLKKELYLTISTSSISVRQLVELLDSIGYAPEINLQSIEKASRPSIDRQLYYQLGVAGFAFGNIMLMSFPEYLGLAAEELWFQQIFGYLNIVLALPVLLYAARPYWQSAWVSLKQRHLNIDVPITLGMLTLFGRSVFEILSQTGAGYLDSLAGLVFFLLIGKWFQQKTYHHLAFERDYKSYFPLAATLLNNGVEKSVAIQQLEVGDILLIRHKDLIPADGFLVQGIAKIDYSFVTGEATPVTVKKDEKIYAGGRQMASNIQIQLTKKVAQSYLTQLWDDAAFQKENTSKTGELANRVGKYFTFAILTIAALTLVYWLPKDMSIAINAFTAVLIIACPCAVALSIPFTFGNVLRLLARQGFYLKNTSVIEALSKINATVFDKTGTLTNKTNNHIEYQGATLNRYEKQCLKKLVDNSSHPLSRMIGMYLSEQGVTDNKLIELTDFEETTGQGLSGQFSYSKDVKGFENTSCLRVGSSNFLKQNIAQNKYYKLNVLLEINGQVKGGFLIQHHYRKGLSQVIHWFRQQGEIFLLSGDNEKEKRVLAPLFPMESLHFQQSPKDKLVFIKKLQKRHQVLMLGDGLNDAGALKQSDVGLVVSENTQHFTPACDAILHAEQFAQLPQFLTFIHRSIYIVYASYFLALIYNVVGLSYAVQGLLSPIVAAILMPLSSVTIVVFGVVATWFIRPNVAKSLPVVA